MKSLVGIAAFAAVQGARVNRHKPTDVDAFAGVTVRGNRNAEEWLVVFKDGTEDADIETFCGGHCSLMGHPSSGGVAFAQVHSRKDLEGMVMARNNAQVEMLEPDDTDYLIPELEDMEASAVASWGLERVGAPTRMATGKGQTVYVQDTGVRTTHRDFEDRASGAIDMTSGSLVECGDDANCAGDRQGHGTHCAGTVGGATFGVANEVTLKAVKTLSDQGSGARAWQMAAIDWITVNGVKPSVISMSLGGSGRDPLYTKAIGAATLAGITVVVAAGNSQADACNFSPAFAERAITVGATQNDNMRASYSNYGTCNDIMAPGSAIVSAASGSDSGSRALSGTSMACPHVSGGAALMLELDPTLTRDGIFAQMTATARTGFVGGLREGDPDLFLWISSEAAPVPVPTPPPAPTTAPCVNGCTTSFCSNNLCKGCSFC